VRQYHCVSRPNQETCRHRGINVEIPAGISGVKFEKDKLRVGAINSHSDEEFKRTAPFELQGEETSA